jgi:hypothetical protein
MAEDEPKNEANIVWVYTAGDEIRIFSSRDTANAWFEKHDPEGVAFGYVVDDHAPLGKHR